LSHLHEGVVLSVGSPLPTIAMSLHPTRSARREPSRGTWIDQPAALDVGSFVGCLLPPVGRSPQRACQVASLSSITLSTAIVMRNGTAVVVTGMDRYDVGRYNCTRWRLFVSHASGGPCRTRRRISSDGQGSPSVHPKRQGSMLSIHQVTPASSKADTMRTPSFRSSPGVSPATTSSKGPSPARSRGEGE
jgi:hypothetical protein